MRRFSKITFYLLLSTLYLLSDACICAAAKEVKISGELDNRVFLRSGVGAHDEDGDGINDGQVGSEEFILSTADVNVNAELSDSVSVSLMMENQKNWGADSPFDATVQLAYVTLKELFYAPLTVTLGRQPIECGWGFIISSCRGCAWDITIPPTGFDAIRATLDYSPWTVDVLYLKDQENSTDVSDDLQFWGTNIGYKFAEYNAEAECYYFGHADSNTPLEPSRRHTFGARGSFEPVANTSLWAEGAYQFGKQENTAATAMRSVSAWAGDVGGEYRFSDYAWKPKLGGEFIYYSGDPNPASTTGKWKEWSAPFKGKYDTQIREFQVNNYSTADRYDRGGMTNEMQFACFGSIEPLGCLCCDIRYTHFRLARKYSSAYTLDGSGNPRSRSRHVGDEIDVGLSYAYNEDVEFGLMGALFIPGDYFDGATGGADAKHNKIAHEVIAAATISF